MRYRALPLVLFHGDGAWTASKRPVELLGEDAPECYQVVSPLPFGAPEPVLRDLPQLVLGLGRSMSDEQAAVELRLLRCAADLADDAELDRVVVGAVRKLLRLRSFPEDLIKEMDTMHAAVEVFQRSLRDSALRNQKKGLEKGRREGLREGHRESRRRLCRMAARKFDSDTVRDLAALLDRVADPARLDEAAEAIMDCEAPEALLQAVRRVATG